MHPSVTAHLLGVYTIQRGSMTHPSVSMATPRPSVHSQIHTSGLPFPQNDQRAYLHAPPFTGNPGWINLSLHEALLPLARHPLQLTAKQPRCPRKASWKNCMRGHPTVSLQKGRLDQLTSVLPQVAELLTEGKGRGELRRVGGGKVFSNAMANSPMLPKRCHHPLQLLHYSQSPQNYSKTASRGIWRTPRKRN